MRHHWNGNQRTEVPGTWGLDFLPQPGDEVAGFVYIAVTGDQDPIVPPEESGRIAESGPRAELTILPGAGHLLYIERTADYRRGVNAWLDAQGDG